MKITKEDILAQNNIKKEVFENPPDRYLSLLELLTDNAVVNIEPSKELLELIEYIDDEKSYFEHNDDGFYDWGEFFIKIPSGLNDFIFGTRSKYAPQAFLISLFRKKIISNLYLPPCFKIAKTGNSYSIMTTTSHSVDARYALQDALRNPEKFNKSVASFKFNDWNAYLKIREEFLKKIAKSNIQSIKPVLINDFKQLFRNLKNEYEFASKKDDTRHLEIRKEELISDCNPTPQDYVIKNFLSSLKDWQIISSYELVDEKFYIIFLSKFKDDLKERINDYQQEFDLLKNKDDKKFPEVINEQKQELPITRIEIVKMPELEVKDYKKPTQKSKEIIICLNQFGDLYREPKSKFCYSMGEKDDRHKIVKHLISNKGYQQTSQIALIFDNKNEDSIVSEIGKINSISKGKLAIKDNIILGKKGSGYRANPDYKFSLKNE